MAATLHGGTGALPWQWLMTRDEEGHRNYIVKWRAYTSSTSDGPQTVMNVPGLPIVGSFWSFGNDVDAWAFCYPDLKITPQIKGEKNTEWIIEQKFSTKPLVTCQDTEVQDPLLEPDKISGGFVKYTREVTEDKDGNRLITSSFEQLRGPQVEFDHNRPTVRIEQNVAALGLSAFSQMIDTVNSATLWGLSSRKVKLSNVSWERRQQGLCQVYYTRIFEFDIDFNTFDKTAMDEGTKVLLGDWNDVTLDQWDVRSGAVATNPAHFKRMHDRDGNPTRSILNGSGVPATSDGAATISIQFYGESNFLTLGIPTTL